MNRRCCWPSALSSAIAVVGLLVIASHGLAVEPSVGGITPYGVQRGTEVEIVLSGGRVADAKEILFYSPGFTVKTLTAENDTTVKALVAVAPDCRLGQVGDVLGVMGGDGVVRQDHHLRVAGECLLDLGQHAPGHLVRPGRQAGGGVRGGGVRDGVVRDGR